RLHHGDDRDGQAVQEGRPPPRARRARVPVHADPGPGRLRRRPHAAGAGRQRRPHRRVPAVPATAHAGGGGGAGGRLPADRRPRADMTVAAVLIGYATLLGFAVPGPLRRARWTRRSPRLAIAVWRAASASAVASAGLAGLALATGWLLARQPA